MKNLLLTLLVLVAIVLMIAGPPTNAVYAYGINPTQTHVTALAAYSAAEPATQLRVYFDNLYPPNTEYATLGRLWSCPTPCNTHGEGEGYNLWLGFGDTNLECENDAIARGEREYMTDMPRIEYYGDPCFPPEVGQTACIFWCCQPSPVWLFWGWSYEEIVE